MKRRVWLAAGALLPLGLAAQPWPSRPVHLIVAYPPGGVSDEIARMLAERLRVVLAVPVVVEHRPGAGGAVAMAALARAAADGHTLCFSAISPLTALPRPSRVDHDLLAGIAPVAGVMTTPVLVVGTPALAEDRFDAVLARARARPGSVRWATSGLGTAGHAVLEQVRRASGVELTHIPYKGGGQQIGDALAGQFELLSTNVAPAQLAYVRAGRLKPLAVGAPARLGVLPEVPTLAELGFPDANLASVFGVFAPAGTPPEVLDRLNAAINRALAEPALRQRVLSSSNTPAGGSRRSFAELIAREARRARASR